MSNTTLLIVDMQNDFITGTLKNEAALETIPFIVEQINNAKENAWNIVCTYDTHHNNYLSTNEGKKLPIEHCIVNTPGQILKLLLKVMIRLRRSIRGSSGTICGIKRILYTLTESMS